MLRTNVNIQRIDNKYMFRYELLNYENLSLSVSDIEKTILDFLYFDLELDENVLQRIEDRLYSKKLIRYTYIYPKDLNERISKFLR